MRILFDTSALYKRYQAEPGRDQVLALGALALEVVVAAHCKAEISSALSRQRHDGMVNAEDYARMTDIVKSDFQDFISVAIDARVDAYSLAVMEKFPLPAMDALHIGSAQAARVDLFVTADKRQALAAQAVGLKTELIEV